MTYIRAWMISKFDQIRSGTTEFAALEHLKINVAPFFVSQLWLYLENSQVSVYKAIGHLVCILSCESLPGEMFTFHGNT